MRKRGRAVSVVVDDVVGEFAFLRIGLNKMSDAFGNLVIGARCVADRAWMDDD